MVREDESNEGGVGRYPWTDAEGDCGFEKGEASDVARTSTSTTREVK